jgi:hypothetical protein
MPIASQRVAKQIPTKANAWSNRGSIARLRRCKEALSTIQLVFSVGSVQSGYKRVKFPSSKLWKNENEASFRYVSCCN